MKPTFFIFCEGKTEAAYVDLLRRTFKIPMEIIVKISDSNISQAYVERCKRDRFTTQDDKTFLMFDIDVPGMFERLNRIKDVTLLLSNPCVEYWFILHYKDVYAELNSAECVAKLRKFDEGYSKGIFSPAMKRNLIEGITEATNRAMAKTPYSNPSSTVYLLTTEILKSQ